MSKPTSVRSCQFCGIHDVWDRVRYLDAAGDLTTSSAAKQFVELRICLTCNAIQSLGPSTIPPEVAIEIRAAELSDLAGSHATRPESIGWLAWARIECVPSHEPSVYTDEWLTGWLGRVINEHGRAP